MGAELSTLARCSTSTATRPSRAGSVRRAGLGPERLNPEGSGQPRTEDPQASQENMPRSPSHSNSRPTAPQVEHAMVECHPDERRPVPIGITTACPVLHDSFAHRANARARVAHWRVGTSPCPRLYAQRSPLLHPEPASPARPGPRPRGVACTEPLARFESPADPVEVDADHEARQMAEVRQRLEERFPDLDPTVVEAAMRLSAAGITGPVRDFVPLLVERAARTRLERAAAGESGPDARRASNSDPIEPGIGSSSRYRPCRRWNRP